MLLVNTCTYPVPACFTLQTLGFKQYCPAAFWAALAVIQETADLHRKALTVSDDVTELALALVSYSSVLQVVY